MGPQLYRCGNETRERLALVGLQLASMGPQLYRCGNESDKVEFTSQEIPLQWGRNFIVAEIDLEGLVLPTGTQLQWGRNFIVAEIRDRS